MNTTVNPSELERCKSGDVGRRLRVLRQGLGWTVADVSDRLRIRKVFLTAIEEGLRLSSRSHVCCWFCSGLRRLFGVGWGRGCSSVSAGSSLPSRQSSLDFPDPDAKKVPLSKNRCFSFGHDCLGLWRVAFDHVGPPDTSLFSLVQKTSERMLSLVEDGYFLGAGSVKKEAEVSPAPFATGC